jgi:hypothetical protein
MREPQRSDLIEHLTTELTERGTDSADSRATSVLVVAAVLAAVSADLIGDAMTGATSTADRQFVAIAAAYLAGDHDLVDAFARDHLSDHPSRPVLDWIVDHSRSAAGPAAPQSPHRTAQP